jgi:hypothetical protein
LGVPVSDGKAPDSPAGHSCTMVCGVGECNAFACPLSCKPTRPYRECLPPRIRDGQEENVGPVRKRVGDGKPLTMSAPRKLRVEMGQSKPVSAIPAPRELANSRPQTSNGIQGHSLSPIVQIATWQTRPGKLAGDCKGLMAGNFTFQRTRAVTAFTPQSRPWTNGAERVKQPATTCRRTSSEARGSRPR